MSNRNKHTRKNSKTTSTNNFIFEKKNYQLLILSILIVLVGFILMMGTNDIYSFTKITIAPLVVVIGFALGFVAILYKPKAK